MIHYSCIRKCSFVPPNPWISGEYLPLTHKGGATIQQCFLGIDNLPMNRLCVITVRNVVAARKCFHRCLSFCPQGGGGVCQTPPGRSIPPAQTPPLDRHTPPGQTHSPGQTHPPPRQTPLRQIGRHPLGRQADTPTPRADTPHG